VIAVTLALIAVAAFVYRSFVGLAFARSRYRLLFESFGSLTPRYGCAFALTRAIRANYSSLELHLCPTALRIVVRRVKRPRRAGMLGLAFDAEDGQTRITKGDNFLLYGGSQDTHAVMQETVLKINEHLDDRGKRLEDVSRKELREILHDVWQEVSGKGE